MTAARQITFSLLVVALAAAGWLAYDRGWFSGSAGPGVVATTRLDASAVRGPGAGGGGVPVRVVTSPVDLDNEGETVRAVGTLTAAQAVTLFPQVTGTVAEIKFAAGEKVAAGDELVRLDDADQRVEVERVTIARDDAKAALDRAERLLASKNITAVAVSDARSVLQKAEIDLKVAELALAKRMISAPFAGVVGITDLSVGDLVTTTKAIANLDDTSTVTVTFEVPERVAGKVLLGQDVEATSIAVPDQVFAGKVSAIDNRIDPTARTLKLEAVLPNDANVLKPGMSVITVLTFPAEARPTVPSMAIQWDRKGSFVWTLDGDTVRRTPIRILQRRNGAVTVSGELQKGQEVVVEGVQRLREGVKVARASEVAPSAGVAVPAAGGEARAGKDG
jgi:RND family efflux transporter MFP subunit